MHGPLQIEALNEQIAAGRIQTTNAIATWDGQTSWAPIASVPGIRLQAAPPSPPPPVGDVTGGLIPYKNPPALISYYCGIAALIPLIGMLFGLAAVVLAIMGFRKRKREPHVKGTAHAVIGLVLGGGSVLVHAAVLVLMGIAASKRP